MFSDDPEFINYHLRLVSLILTGCSNFVFSCWFWKRRYLNHLI